MRHSIYCRPWYILGSVEVTQLHPCMWGCFQALPGRLQGRPRASRAACTRLQGALGASSDHQNPNIVLNEKCPAAYCQSLEPWARLKFHAGWSGWTRPPSMAGGGMGCGQGWACLQKRGFLKGSERPEAGRLGELKPQTLNLKLLHPKP